MSLSVVSRSLKSTTGLKVSKDVPTKWNLNIESDKKNKYIIKSDFLNSAEFKKIIGKILNWISLNGETEIDDKLLIDLSIENKSPIDSVKFVIFFDESIINKNRSFTSCTIKNLKPNINNGIFDTLKLGIYSIEDSDGKGIALTNSNLGNLRIKYIGGKDYHKDVDYIFKIIDESFNATKKSIEFTQDSNFIYEFKKLTENIRKLNECGTYINFKRNYPKIKLSIDLNKKDEVLTPLYPKIKDVLLNIIRITNSNINRNFYINYDSDLSKFQIKGGKFENIDFSIFDGLEFIDCKFINCYIKLALFHECSIDKSKVINSTFKYHTTVKNSFLINPKIGESCEIDREKNILEYDIR